MKFFALSCLLSLLLLSSCIATDVGKSCPINEAGQKQVEDLKGKKVRVAIPSFRCALNFCFATFYNEADPTQGYCSKICNAADECPKGFTCETIVELKKEALPPEHRESLAELIGQKICMKPAPSPEQ